MVEKVLAKADRFKNPTIALLVVTDKPDIDDLRESPALAIATDLRDRGMGDLLVVEPNVPELRSFALTPLDEALKRADIVVFLVPHASFKKVQRVQLAEKIIIDTCGVTHRK